MEKITIAFIKRKADEYGGITGTCYSAKPFKDGATFIMEVISRRGTDTLNNLKGFLLQQIAGLEEATKKIESLLCGYAKLTKTQQLLNRLQREMYGVIANEKIDIINALNAIIAKEEGRAVPKKIKHVNQLIK